VIKISDIDHRFGGNFFRINMGVAVKNHHAVIVPKRKAKGNLPPCGLNLTHKIQKFNRKGEKAKKG
jgi:hypothetical protein